MTQFRAIVSVSVSDGDAFSVVAEILKTSVRSDVQSFDDEPIPQETQKSLTAKVQQSDEEIFQYGRDFEKTQANKRQRLSSSRSNGHCNYWDRKICDYEEKTDRPWRYSENHIPGKITFKNPFNVKLEFNPPPPTIRELRVMLYLTQP